MLKTVERLHPTEDRVIVVPIAIADTSQGGIVVPDVAKEKPSRGVIQAVGPGRFENGALIPMRLAEGDVVLFGKYAGTPYETADGEVLVFREMDILSTITVEQVEMPDAPAQADPVRIEDLGGGQFRTPGPL